MAAGWRRIDPIARPLQARLERAIPRAIDDTTAAAAISAKQHHGWRNRTGTAEGSIRMEPAERRGALRWRGRFGSFDVDYFIFLELGAHYASARGFQHDTTDFSNVFVGFRSGDHTLRRAADAEFPTLGARLRRHLS